MARIVLGTFAFRYPLGGMLSWNLQWALGLQRLGHDVFLTEKSSYPDACFDPIRKVASDDCSYAVDTVGRLLARHGLDRRWCYVDQAGRYFGLPRDAIETVFRSADLFVDLGTHGTWLGEAAAASSCRTVLVDGEPGYTQMRRALKRERGEGVPRYDVYYSNGAALATPAYAGPTDGIVWRAVFNPVVLDPFPDPPPAPPDGAPFSTVMTWQTHPPLNFGGRTWRQKDVEFEKFIDLPRRCAGAAFDLAVSGRAPYDALHANGWRTRSARETTLTYDGYAQYIARSAGEFSACKEAYVALRTGWFSDRSAAYLAAGRPVVMQETGFSAHLPCGQGLFAAATAEEACDAIARIVADYPRHSRAARRIAAEHLAADRVLPRFLAELGV